MLLSLGSLLVFSLLVPMSDVRALYVIPKQAGQAWALPSTHGWRASRLQVLFRFSAFWVAGHHSNYSFLWFELEALRKQQLIKAPWEADKHCNPHL